jgi:hypothetical protein
MSGGIWTKLSGIGLLTCGLGAGYILREWTAGDIGGEAVVHRLESMETTLSKLKESIDAMEEAIRSEPAAEVPAPRELSPVAADAVRIERLEALVDEVRLALEHGSATGVKAVTEELRRPKDLNAVTTALSELRQSSATLQNRTFCALPWQIYAEFGRPDAVTLEGTRTVWRYWVISPSGDPIEALKLTFADGVVVDVTRGG